MLLKIKKEKQKLLNYCIKKPKIIYKKWDTMISSNNSTNNKKWNKWNLSKNIDKKISNFYIIHILYK